MDLTANNIPVGSSWKKTKTTGYNRHQLRERLSLGIACVRFNASKPEILMIQKRHTYNFSLFVHGKYNPNDISEILRLLNGMTVEEKLDLLSLNFSQVWYRIWLDSTSRSVNYYTAKSKFESNFAADGGVKLRRLINKSTHGECVWEIPKGRKKNKTESDAQCAMREFYEETKVSKGSYYLWLNAKRTYSYVDEGTKYINQYFIAYTRHNIEPRVDFKSPDQIEEVANIKWMDIEDLRRADTTGKLARFIKPIFNYVKKHKQ